MCILNNYSKAVVLQFHNKRLLIARVLIYVFQVMRDMIINKQARLKTKEKNFILNKQKYCQKRNMKSMLYFWLKIKINHFQNKKKKNY